MNEEKKEKILIYSLIFMVCAILIVVICIIWSSNFSKLDTKNRINTYDNLSYETTMEKYYRNFLQENLKITNFDKLYEKLDSKYIASIGVSEKEEVKEYLKNNKLISMTFTINDIELMKSEYGNNIFLVSYTILNEQKYVNVIETTPYNFKLSFIEDNNLKSLISGKSIGGTVDNVDYDFEVIDSQKNSIRLKLTITNKSEKTITYDFSYLNSLQLRYGDEKYMNMAVVANSATVNYEILPESSKSIEVLFNLSLEDQVNIQGAKINNVKVDGKAYTVEI